MSVRQRRRSALAAFGPVWDATDVTWELPSAAAVVDRAGRQHDVRPIRVEVGVYLAVEHSGAGLGDLLTFDLAVYGKTTEQAMAGLYELGYQPVAAGEVA